MKNIKYWFIYIIIKYFNKIKFIRKNICNNIGKELACYILYKDITLIKFIPLGYTNEYLWKEALMLDISLIKYMPVSYKDDGILDYVLLI
jgi:hypothetical protein